MWGEHHVTRRQSTGWCFYKPRDTSECQKTPQSRQDHVKGTNSLLWTQKNLQKFEMINFCCLSSQVYATLLRKFEKTNISNFNK